MKIKTNKIAWRRIVNAVGRARLPATCETCTRHLSRARACVARNEFTITFPAHLDAAETERSASGSFRVNFLIVQTPKL